MLDLDVGFLESPKHMVQAFVETPIVDIFVQVRPVCRCWGILHSQHCELTSSMQLLYHDTVMSFLQRFMRTCLLNLVCDAYALTGRLHLHYEPHEGRLGAVLHGAAAQHRTVPVPRQ
jgi:hypothetical protein